MHQDLSSDIKWNTKIIIKEELLENGSFGMVSKTLNVNTKNFAVLKESINLKQSKKQSEQIWKSVSGHPYIVQLFASFYDEGRMVYVYEYLPNGSLWSFINVHKKLNTEVAMNLTSQIALAIHFIHGKNIFHRDISNKNIYLSQDGKAKLSNFQHSETTKISQGLHGDYLYKAPEVFSGSTYDVNADWFSLGVCLYEMVVGMTPVELHCLQKGIDFQKLDDFGKIAVMMTSTYYIPKVFPKKLKEAVVQLLSKVVKKRLGYNDDLESLKQHPFFRDVNWRSLECGELAADLPEESCSWWEKNEAMDNITK